jgi:hypothetical protein
MGEFLLRPQLIDSGVVTVSVEVDTEGSWSLAANAASGVDNQRAELKEAIRGIRIDCISISHGSTSLAGR